MPYKDKAQQQAAQKKWYERNKDAVIQRTSDRRRNSRKWLLVYKAHLSCILCGEDHPATLDFHHRNPEDKVMSITEMASKGYKIEEILAEIEKCDVLCANCHRKLHWELSTVR